MLLRLDNKTYYVKTSHAALKGRGPGDSEKSPMAPLKSELSNRLQHRIKKCATTQININTRN